jgi:hypothetical protein
LVGGLTRFLRFKKWYSEGSNLELFEVEMVKIARVTNTEILPAIDHKVVAQALTEIRNAGQNATTAYLHLADTIVKWNANKDWNEIERTLISEQILSDSVLKKLMLIGSNSVLMDRKNWTKLPLGYNHLYPFTQISQDKLEKLIVDGTIHNGLSVKESNELKEQFRTKKAPVTKNNNRITITIKIKLSVDIKNIKTKFNTKFDAFKNEIHQLDATAEVELK